MGDGDRAEIDPRLRESEARYQAVIENASDMIQSVRPDGTFEFVNRAWHEKLGYTPDDLTGMIVWDIIHPDCHRALPGHSSWPVIRGETIEVCARRSCTKDGRPIPVEGSVDVALRRRQGRRHPRLLPRHHGAAAGAGAGGAERPARARAAGPLPGEDGGAGQALRRALARAEQPGRGRAAGERRAWPESLTRRDAAARELIGAGAHGGAVAGAGAGWSTGSPLGRTPAIRTRWQSASGRKRSRAGWRSTGSRRPGSWPPCSWPGRRHRRHGLALARRSVPVGGVAGGGALDRRVGRGPGPDRHRRPQHPPHLGAGRRGQGATRIMDRADEQDVDVHDGLENTLVILAHRLTERDRAARLRPHGCRAVRAYGNSLNQVWTNIIDNAVERPARARARSRSGPAATTIASSSRSRTTAAASAERHQPHLRAVLHHQAAGAGHRAGPGHRLADRHRGARRHHRRGIRTGPHRLPRFPPGGDARAARRLPRRERRLTRSRRGVRPAAVPNASRMAGRRRPGADAARSVSARGGNEVESDSAHGRPRLLRTIRHRSRVEHGRTPRRGERRPPRSSSARPAPAAVAGRTPHPSRVPRRREGGRHGTHHRRQPPRTPGRRVEHHRHRGGTRERSPRPSASCARPARPAARSRRRSTASTSSTAAHSTRRPRSTRSSPRSPAADLRCRSLTRRCRRLVTDACGHRWS